MLGKGPANLALIFIALAVVLGFGALAFKNFAGGADPYHIVTPAEAPILPPDQLPTGEWPALGNADFFGQVKDRFIADGNKFIEADLSAMKLTVYASGTPVKVVPILTKGREGSWWETPAGLYTIETKERNHFSTFGHVYQPWSMAFQGNFFIHGWPYYPGGEDVSSQYSGGCIRLSTADAKAVYDLINTGTPVLVFEKDFVADNFTYTPKTLPGLDAGSYLAADLGNNFVFASKKLEEPMPVASLTKLMTALVAAEYINLDKTVVVQKGDVVPTSVPRLKADERRSAYQLLYPLLEESSNEAAFALADAVGRERFVSLMNKKAEALGMRNTSFVDPAGVEEGNVSTPEDLFLLAKYLLNNRSFVLKISSGTLGPNVYGPAEFKNLKNFNVFTSEDGFLGGKVGKSTIAKETIISIFKKTLNGSERDIVVVVLGSEHNADDARNLLNQVTANYNESI
jgi:D-alanyl-D-alanine carboxypeptidase